MIMIGSRVITQAGYEVVLTVTESDGVTVKGTTTLTTAEIPWWGGQTGFSTKHGRGWFGILLSVRISEPEIGFLGK